MSAGVKKMKATLMLATLMLALATGTAASSHLDGASARISRRSDIRCAHLHQVTYSSPSARFTKHASPWRRRSFVVMDVLANAQRLEAEGKSIMHMEVGQPGSGAPIAVRESAKTNLGDSPEVPALGYTSAVGIPKLQQCIADFYEKKYGVKDLDTDRIFVTTGSSVRDTRIHRYHLSTPPPYLCKTEPAEPPPSLSS